ncbi:MAG: hypothetical protein R8G33_04200 [Gammaproteobacteria bacterium]|nr:hypothetical protein [Gammaproteobacteria bacterium]
MKIFLLIMICVFVQSISFADQNVQELNGISIIGNKELPKSLVIVPWKASLPGEGDFFLQRHMNEYMKPVDKEVFERKVDFYQQSRK